MEDGGVPQEGLVTEAPAPQQGEVPVLTFSTDSGLASSQPIVVEEKEKEKEGAHPLLASDELSEGWEQVQVQSRELTPSKDPHRGRSLSLQYFSADEPPTPTPQDPSEKPSTPPTPPVNTSPSSTSSSQSDISKEKDDTKDTELSPEQQTSTELATENESEEVEVEGGEEDAKAAEDTAREKKEREKNEREKKAALLRTLFTAEGFPALQERALAGDLHHTDVRGISWRVFLGVLPPDTSVWEEKLKEHRGVFEKIRDKHTVDPHTVVPDSELDKFNPLSQHEENPWTQYFQNAEMQKEITHDVLRTYPGVPFFDLQSTKDTMTNLLFLYAKENSNTRYIQGMNELLAPILYVLHHEKVTSTESTTAFDLVKDERYLDHDAYTLFAHLLLIVGRWFSPLRSGNSPLPTKKSLLEDKLYFSSGQADESTNLQIVQQCRHIHYELLNEVDPHLARYLKDLQIEPHLYMLRWVRIMLTQVFLLQDVLVLWDGIFAFGKNVALLDWLCVAMLVNIRHLLLGQDYSICMSHLFSYPQDADIHLLVTTAQRLHQKYQSMRHIAPSLKSQEKPVKATPPAATHKAHAKPAQQKPATPPLQQSTGKQSPPPAQQQQTQRATSSPQPQFLPAFLEPKPVPPPGEMTNYRQEASNLRQENQGLRNESQFLRHENYNLRAESHYLRNTSEHMAIRLERALYILGNLQSSPETDEAVKSAVEEINQVKAILNEVSKLKPEPAPHPDGKTDFSKPSPPPPTHQTPPLSSSTVVSPPPSPLIQETAPSQQTANNFSNAPNNNATNNNNSANNSPNTTQPRPSSPISLEKIFGSFSVFGRATQK